jgi:hypothetical protein
MERGLRPLELRGQPRQIGLQYTAQEVFSQVSITFAVKVDRSGPVPFDVCRVENFILAKIDTLHGFFPPFFTQCYDTKSNQYTLSKSSTYI